MTEDFYGVDKIKKNKNTIDIKKKKNNRKNLKKNPKNSNIFIIIKCINNFLDI